MRVAVLTVDQRGSTKRAATGPGARRPGRARRPGDVAAAPPVRAHRRRRVPGRARRPAAPGRRSLERLLREDAWNIGVGIGQVDEPLPESTRAGRGPAYVHARDAVTGAKSSPWHLRVVGDVPGGRAGWRPRCGSGPRSWPGAPRGAGRSPTWSTAACAYDEAAERLGISQSAVSQRAQAAGIVEGRRARELVTELTADLLAGRTAS